MNVCFQCTTRKEERKQLNIDTLARTKLVKEVKQPLN